MKPAAGRPGPVGGPPDHEGAFPLPHRFATAGGRVSLVVKRVFDIVASATALIVLSPVLVSIALAVSLDSGRPILYPWRVVGRRGRYFTGYKFRTMTPDADRRLADLAAQNEMVGPMFKMKHDPRVTRVGRVLRRFSLDELPQLWSVLKGDMTVVGPRPPLQREWEQFTPWQRRKLSVTPGLTCLWQISGRADIRDFDEWVTLDLEYIERWSLWLDLKILLRTILVVASGRGAY